MSDLKLYEHLKEFVSEVHTDGMCFVEPYNYAEFVEGLDIKDCESGFDAYITSYGTLCFDIDDIGHLFDDFDEFKETFMNGL